MGKRVQPSVTIPIRKSKKKHAHFYKTDLPTDHQRPQVRGDCVDGLRPCPYVGCSNNLYLDVNRETGAIKLNFPDVYPHEMKVSCALDVADKDGVTLEEVGEMMNVTRERVRQIEKQAIDKVFMAWFDFKDWMWR